MKQKKSSKRGYAVALLVGFDADQVIIWQIFSHTAKLQAQLKLDGSREDAKSLYNFHESIVNSLRPMLEEGVRSVVVAAPARTTYAQDFLDHVAKHHSYLVQTDKPNRTAFARLVGSADQPHEVAELVKTQEFRRLVVETTSEEADHIVNILEKCLFGKESSSLVLYSLKEIEDTVYSQVKSNENRTKYLLLTDTYLASSKDKNRINRLLQISKNRNVKTRVFNSETPAGKRINQFGGIVYFSAPHISMEVG